MRTRRILNLYRRFVFAIFTGLILTITNTDCLGMTQRTIKSASELYYPPFALVGPDGSADGFSVDLLKAVAKAVDLEVDFSVGPWHEIKQELADGHLDALPLVSYSRERENMFDFTAPYLRMHGTIFVRKGDRSIRGKADLKDKRVLVMRGDTAHEYAQKENLSRNLVLTDTFEEAMRLLSEGKHDAVIIQQLVGLQLIKKLGITNLINVSAIEEKSLKPVDRPLSGFEQKFCIAVKDGDSELLTLLNEGLAITIANGTYDALYSKWFSPILPEPPVPLSLILKYVLFILAPILFLLAIIGLWYMNCEIKRKTRSLRQEISERKLAEETLRESEERFRILFEHAPDPIYINKVDGTLVGGNKAAEAITGYTTEELIGSNFLEKGILSEADLPKAVSHLEKNQKGESTGPDEFILRRKSGETVYVEISTHPVIIKGELQVLGIARDVTHRKKTEEVRQKLEAQLQQAQKLESVGRLAGGVAHDFNNKLGIIIGNVEMAMMGSAPDSPMREELYEIMNAAKHSATLVRQLLGFARKQAVNPEVLNLNDSISGMLKMLRRLIGEDIDLAWVPGHDLWHVEIDPSQVDQILVNLTVNARDAIPGVGKMTIETKNTILDESYCVVNSACIPGRYVLLAVSDNGIGIDKASLENIFEPFFTTKEVGKGTGLGLSTVYGIVKQNNGFINVYSELGKGTTFRVYLPMVEVGETALREATESGSPQGGTETILLVEDEESILKVGGRILEGLGYRVFFARKPSEAIELAESHAGSIALILTDVVMPEMNGKELVEQIKSKYPGMKSLYMSGYTADVIAHHGVLDKNVMMVQKPFSVWDLGTKVREVLDRN